MLDEGAGDLDSKTFHQRLEDQAIEIGFQRRPRLFPRLAAHAQREPRRGLRPAASGADGAALRRRRARARARAGTVRIAARYHQSERSRQPQLVEHRVSRSSLRPRKQGHAGKHGAHHRRRPARLCAPRVRAQRAHGLDRRRHRRRDRRRADRPRLRRAAGEERPQAGGRREAQQSRAPHRHRRRCAAGGGQFRRPGHRPSRSRFHGRLYRQPHPGRRQLLLAALSGGAREARPGLWRFRPVWSGSGVPPS